DGSYILISEDGENLNSRKTPIAFEATGKFWVNNHAHVLKAKKPHLTALIIQYFSQLDLSPYLTGAAQPKLNKASLNLIPLYLPIDESEQKAIASILSSLKDKIDLLHCQNKTLESMAETLFRQWFILDSTGVSVSIDQIIDFNPKRTLIKSQDATYLDMAGLSTVNFRANGYYRRPFSSGTKFTKRDTLLARITPCLENGKAAYIDFLDDNETGWGSTEFIVMRPKKEIHPFISYIMCRNPDFKEYAESCMEGSSGRQRVNLDHLKKFNVNLPTEASLRIINELLDSFESKLINNSKQIDSLEKLRDTLLPKLMSGEVRVQYAEEAIASVA
ncbi:restriction endonuclease subunit S, partial [Salmonella enterica]